jgi:predicted permease
MTGFWQDVRYGAHLLRNHFAFTMVAALTLAIGIGATTTIFGVVDAVILRPLPFADPDRLVQIWETNPNGDDFSSSEPNFLDFLAENRSLVGLGAFRPTELAVTGDGEPKNLRGVAVSQSLFPVLGIRPALGRVFSPEEDIAGDSSRVVMLSHAFWSARYGNDSAIVGRAITLGGRPHTVIGVLAREQQFPAGDAFVPLHASRTSDRGDHWLSLVGRLRPTATVVSAQTELATVARRLGTRYPENAGWGTRTEQLSLALVDAKVRRGGWVLLAATGLLLLLACANVANLLLVRSTTRQTEMGVRAAIGADQSRLVRQSLVESALLVLVAAVLGVLAAVWGTDGVRALAANRIPRLDLIAVDGRVIAIAVALTVVTALVCGLPPALRAGRVDPATVLGDSVRGGVTRGHRRVRDALVVFQIALSILLLVGAGLLTRSFSRLGAVNVGYDLDHVIAVNLSLPRHRYDEEGQAIFFARLTRSLSGLPAVRAAGATVVDPLTDWNLMNNVTPEDRAATTPASGFMQSGWRTVTPGLFSAMGIPLLRGRVFSTDDAWNGPRIAVVSQRFAERMWPGQDAIGKRFYWGGTTGNTRTVIGVVGDIRDIAPQAEPIPMMFLPFNQLPMAGMTLIVRSVGDPMALADGVRNAVRALDRNLPVPDIRPLRRNHSDAIAAPRFNAALIAGFAAVALMLACSGLYAVVAFNVARRRREIGVRLAIGALPAQVVNAFVRHGMRLTIAGVTIGLIVTFGAARLVRGLLYEVSPLDPMTFAAVTLLLVVVALVATYVPARRAASIAPGEALRNE